MRALRNVLSAFMVVLSIVGCLVYSSLVLVEVQIG
jgi:hypothetical protein